jgi:glycosyltransferase involved in cell wall biosynthesis
VRVVADGGYVACDEAQWVEALRALAQDAALRARLGAVARERVEREFSFNRWLPAMAALLR